MTEQVTKLPAAELAERLVRNEIYYCVSSLFYELREVIDQTDWADEYATLQQSEPDYEEAASGAGWELIDALWGEVFVREDEVCGSWEESARLYGWDLADTTEPEDDDSDSQYKFVREAGATFERTLVTEVKANDEDGAWEALCKQNDIKCYEVDEADDWEELCDSQNIDPNDYRNEIYEHWLISGWLKRKLAAHGETVGDFMGLIVWGRGCTGQSVALDRVIQRIAAEVWPEEWNGCWDYSRPAIPQPTGDNE